MPSCPLSSALPQCRGRCPDTLREQSIQYQVNWTHWVKLANPKLLIKERARAQPSLRRIGRWYQGNLFTHSNRSDGHTTPAEVCAFYPASGYDFISITDQFLESHQFPFKNTAPFRTAGFTTILGTELHAPATNLGDLWQILVVGFPDHFQPLEIGETSPQLAEQSKAAGTYVAAAHPAWYDPIDQDLFFLPAAGATEIFNTICAENNGKGNSAGKVDCLLIQDRHYQILPPTTSTSN